MGIGTASALSTSLAVTSALRSASQARSALPVAGHRGRVVDQDEHGVDGAGKGGWRLPKPLEESAPFI
jgi:hypothetical protein